MTDVTVNISDDDDANIAVVIDEIGGVSIIFGGVDIIINHAQLDSLYTEIKPFFEDEK